MPFLFRCFGWASNYPRRGYFQVTDVEAIDQNPNSKIEIEIQKSSDNRSYHINSDKVYKILNFRPKYSIENAIEELYQNFNNGNIVNSFDDNIYFNVKRMKDLNVKWKKKLH